MVSKVILGLMIGYKFDSCRNWVRSAMSVKDDETDVVLIVFNSDKETIESIQKEGVKVIHFENYSMSRHIVVERFIHMYDFLTKNENYEWVVATDVKDVIFQKNPFDFMHNNFGMTITSSLEGLTYENEDWGNNNLLNSFGPYIHHQFKNKPIHNAGVIAGQSDIIAALSLQIFLMSVGAGTHNPDQAAYNLLMNSSSYSLLNKAYDSDSEWAAQLGTYMDPLKIERFKPNLSGPLPIFNGKELVNHLGKPYHIVHQYDRVPELKKYYDELFN